MKLADIDRKQLLPMLNTLAGAVEQMLLSGLTTASDATRRTLQVSFEEASRLRLLRLGSTLRVANEELGRFTRNEETFSKRRLSFFLGRTWLLSRGLSRAIERGDESHFQQLLFVPPSAPVQPLEVVALGVAKKHVKNTFCGFDFRLRTTSAAGEIPAGQPLVWSCIFPLKAGVEVPPEGFLHLPQKQGFKPHIFVEEPAILIEGAAVSLDERGSGRLVLGEQSKLTQREKFTDWSRFNQWQPQAAIDRVQSHSPGPFDLEIELQEEIVLTDYQFRAGPPCEREGQVVYDIAQRGVPLELVASGGAEGESLRAALPELAKAKSRPPLFGLLHYQMCRLIVQPLSLLKPDGPQHLMISEKDIDRKALLAALKF